MIDQMQVPSANQRGDWTDVCAPSCKKARSLRLKSFHPTVYLWRSRSRSWVARAGSLEPHQSADAGQEA